MREQDLKHGAVIVGPPLFPSDEQAVEYVVVGGASRDMDHVVVDRGGVPYRLSKAQLRGDRFKLRLGDHE